LGYEGILFDLFGTLVPPFPMDAHREAIGACARHLGIDEAACHREWGETYGARSRGGFASIAENLGVVAQNTGSTASPESLSEAEAIYHRFTRASLMPAAGAIETLQWLRAAGFRLGLVTNCAIDVPLLWPESPLSEYFSCCAFSCRVGVPKPAAAIYQYALAALDLRPEETLYVGDGSDGELSGAARCRLRPVLLRVDLSNAYDAAREDVENWAGPSIDDLGGLRELLR